MQGIRTMPGVFMQYCGTIRRGSTSTEKLSEGLLRISSLAIIFGLAKLKFTFELCAHA